MELQTEDVFYVYITYSLTLSKQFFPSFCGVHGNISSPQWGGTFTPSHQHHGLFLQFILMIKMKSRKTPSAVGTSMKNESLAQRKRVASTGSDIILPGPLFHVSVEEKELRKVKETDRKRTDGHSPDGRPPQLSELKN